MVLALLQTGAKDEVNAQFGAKRESALHVAAVQGTAKVSKALLLADADPNMLNGDMESPLHMAAEAGHHEVVTILLLKGASPHAKTRCERTPLHLAAWRGYDLCVSALVLGGADTDSRDCQGATSLFLAAKGNRVGAVEEFSAAGGNVDIRHNNGGWCPLDVAAEKGHVGVARELFLRHGSSVEVRGAQGFTALRCAAHGLGRDNGDVIRMLLEAGADVDSKVDWLACTPLHIAAAETIASRSIIHALLEGGANVNARDANDGTPLHNACFKSCVGAVELRLRWGADEELIDEREETPEDVLGQWEETEQQDGEEQQQRKADDQSIRHMLARAPADRSWHRRGWLILSRSFPDKVQFAEESSRNGDSSAKVPWAGCKEAGGSGNGSRELAVDLEQLVSRVFELKAEGVFRLVVSFL